MNHIFFCILFSLLYSHSIGCGGVTNDVGGGRLGDRIIGYVRSKLLAEEKGVPFYFSYFKYAEYFNFYHVETPLPQNISIKVIDHLRYFTLPSSFIYRCPVWLTSQNVVPDESDNTTHFERINAADIKYLLTPCKKPNNYIEIPEDATSIAIHIRQPSGNLHDLHDCNFSHLLHSRQLFDVAYVEQTLQAHSRFQKSKNSRHNRDRGMDEKFPYKFPPIQYYIDQLNILAQELSHKKIFVYIFTDWDNPFEIRDVFRKQFQEQNIVIESREFNNHEQFIIDDLLNMARFEYLIRSNSGFAQAAQLIGNFKKSIYPKRIKWFDDYLVVQETVHQVS